MKKIVFIVLAVVAAISLILVGCGEPEATPTATPTTTPTASPTASPTKPAPYGTIRIANADFGNESFDPDIMGSVWHWYVLDRLVTQDIDGKVIPYLAESFEFDPDTGIWTFHIREGIKFHNGDPLTAEDVKFSIDRFGDTSVSGNPWSPYIGAPYNKVETRIIDDYTVQFVPDHPELQQGIVFAQTVILPKNYFESVGQDGFNRQPIGSGPWKFVELIPKTKLTLEANTDYWGEVPAFQYLVEQMVPEQSTRIAMLKSGDVDIIFPQSGIDPDRIAELEDLGFRTVDLGLPSAYTFAFQATWVPGAGGVSDIRVRQAMSCALNREEICATWYQGYAKPGGPFFMLRGGGDVSPGFGWSDDLLPDPYDPAKAEALLAEAGYPDKWDDPSIHFFCPPYMQDFALVLIGYWQAVGLDVKLEVVDVSVYYGLLFTRAQEGDQNVGWLWPWSTVGVPNCTYHCANMYTNWGVHGTSNDVKATQMYDDYLKITDLAASEQAWNEFQKYVKSLYVNLGVVEIDPVYVVGPELGEFTGYSWMSNHDAITGVQHAK
jgi:peptide/nickel transport system substrate-binding protein